MPTSALCEGVWDCHGCRLAGNALTMALVLHHQGLFNKLVINLEHPMRGQITQSSHGQPYEMSHNPPVRSYELDDVVRWHLHLMVARGMRPYVVYGCCVSLPVDIGELAYWRHRPTYHPNLHLPTQHPAWQPHFSHQQPPVEPLPLPHGTGIVPAVVYNPASPLAGTYMALNLTGSTALYLSDSLLLHLQDTSLSSANLQALKWPPPEAPASRWADTISCAPFNWSFPASGTWYDLPQGPWGLVALRDEDTVNSGSQLCFFCRAEVSEHDHGECCPIFNYLFTGVRELQRHGSLAVNGVPCC